MTVVGGTGHDPAMADRSGPLSGIKIIELAGIGPAPYTCMMLADAGAQVLRLERARAGCGRGGGGVQGFGQRAVLGPAEPVPALGRHRSEEPRRGRARARARSAEADGSDRGVPARRGRATGRRARRLLRAQPPVGLRTHDGLGPGRADGARWPATTSTTSPSAVPCGRWAGPTRHRCRRSTSWGTSAVAACCWPSAWWPRCSRRPAPARARWSTPPWWTARRPS